ncbi:transcriptional activator FtrA [Gimesia panareensis]|uniref:Transcriptional activator FtrA n=1 Tax=Gimesia panareensis TaxID=2527978 RepID=A0A517Q6T0_9PLAN|nr:helix-turn-helix domain-containing protein [Gimesia panareensis]QDT27318.1 transcriptional activator FtrA [Gimesia panareensis]
MLESRTRFKNPLDRFVKCLWHSAGEHRDWQRERILPTGSVDLVFKLQEDRPVQVFDPAGEKALSFSGATVSGAYSRHFALDTSRPVPTIGIHFHPGGAAPFLGVPAGELRNQHVSLQEFWGADALHIREQLMQVTSVSARFNLLEQALLNRLTELPRNYRAILYAAGLIRTSPSVSVKSVSESLGFSNQRLIRQFQNAVGLSPKLYCRIQRFQSVLDQIVSSEPISWVNVALDNGYYDQSHLIHDFREFTGVTPAEYRPVAPDRKNHMRTE